METNIPIIALSKIEATARFFKELRDRGTLQIVDKNYEYPYTWFDINSKTKLV